MTSQVHYIDMLSSMTGSTNSNCTPPPLLPLIVISSCFCIFQMQKWVMQRDESRYFPSIQKGMKYEEELLSRLRAICLIQCVGYRLEL